MTGLFASTLLLLCGFLAPGLAHEAKTACYHSRRNNASIYDYRVETLSKYFPDKDIQDYKDFALLAFPCNQFGMQEPGAGEEEILNGIRYVRPGNDFQPTFPVFAKINVNGEDEHELYTYLKRYCPAPDKFFRAKHRLYYDKQEVNDIRWNFEKFLIDKHGRPYMRYNPTTAPDSIRADIEQLLNQPDL
ncbi:unnamed protein product [Owenia fusiformis]|uniref:Glutathione peroxidase n=1 Tax=Owenia fusiformis TaxID=6347 RepID=A0A8S4PLJ6_OWEFU|nr:unnamed protein product [Owenia fusiformis]